MAEAALSPRIAGVKALIFDTFGTLVDWRTSIARESEIVLIRAAGTPCAARKFLIALARRSPSARLYSRVPRSSQWPSIVTRVAGCAISQFAWLSRIARASGSMSLYSARFARQERCRRSVGARLTVLTDPDVTRP